MNTMENCMICERSNTVLQKRRICDGCVEGFIRQRHGEHHDKLPEMQ